MNSATRAVPNFAFWLIWLLPGLAVAGSFTSLYFSVHGGDAPLPSAYHWEGQALGADEARQRRAAELGIAALLRFDAASGRCQLRMQGDAPASVRVELVHPTQGSADRHLQMQREGEGYVAACSALPAAHWWVQISDPSGRWQLRARVRADFRDPVYVDGGVRD